MNAIFIGYVLRAGNSTLILRETTGQSEYQKSFEYLDLIRSDANSLFRINRIPVLKRRFYRVNSGILQTAFYSIRRTTIGRYF